MREVFEILYEYLLWTKATSIRLLNQHKSHLFTGTSNVTLVFISGIFGGTTMYHLKSYARRHKISYLSVDFGFQLGDIDQYAHKLKSELAYHNINSQIILIGWSMGGLIGMRFAQLYGWTQIDKFFAIATPFGGAPITRYLPFFSAKQMRPGNPFLPNLLKNINRKKVLCGYFKYDRHVSKSSAIIAGCRSIEFPYGGHFTNSQKRNFEAFCKQYLSSLQV